MKPSHTFLWLSIAGMLTSCSSDPGPEAASPASANLSASASKPATAPSDPALKMARAVGNGKPGAAVDIRYEILARPEVGAPTEVEIVFIPSAGVDALVATISGMDGITVAGELKPSFSSVEPGTPYKHTFSLLPDRTGVFYITVSVDTQIGGSTLGRTFSIPFAVGDVQVRQKSTPEPVKDATGQAIQPMKAKETTG